MFPTRLVIDLSAIQNNLAAARGLAGKGTRLWAVVKADAYGHGLLPVARALEAAGADGFCVFRTDEALRLREDGHTLPVLALAQPLPEEAEAAARNNVTCSVHDLSAARDLAAAARRAGAPVKVHVKVDTGMGRLGIPPERLLSFLDSLEGMEGLLVDGAYTHFATADCPEDGFCGEQLDCFLKAAGSCLAKGLALHAANSAGLMRGAGAGLPAARPGILLYGLSPCPGMPGSEKLKPAMRLSTQIAAVRELPGGSSVSYGRTFTLEKPSQIATLPLGYADGYPRALSNKASVLVRGRRAPQTGIICMNLCMADTGGIPDVAPGDEAVLLGAQGGEEITAAELASLAGTIGYELFCGLGAANPKEYVFSSSLGADDVPANGRGTP
jgi:alanine racemase